MPHAKYILLIALLLLIGPACDWRQSPESQHLPTEVGIFEDTSGQMEISQAASPLAWDDYEVIKGNRMSLGFNKSALWVRIPLAQIATQGPWVLEVAAPWMDKVDFYLPKPDGGWRRQSTGLQQPPATGGTMGLALAIPAGTPRTGFAYLRLQSVLSLNAGLRLWPKAEFVEHKVNRSYMFGALYGIMGAMVLANLIVLLTTRDRAYLLYVLYLCSIMFHQICLQGQILLAPKSFWPWVPDLSLVVSSTTFFFGAAFCRAFLNAKTYAPVADRVLLGIQMAAVLLFALALAGHLFLGTWLVHSLAVIAPVVAIVAGAKAFYRGFRPARAYLPAWIILLLGAMAWGAWSMGWNLFVPLPPSTITFAAALESALLSLALADRVGVMQRERQLLAQRERRYRQMSITDDLTGLFNARYFWSKLDSEIKHCHALGQPLGLVILDVDDFKCYNDEYGHTEGDKVLAEIGSLLRAVVRPADSPCRYGGEEFALVLPGAIGKASREVAERVRNNLAWRVFKPMDGARVQITASLGTAQLLPGDDAKSLVKRADQALYQAKAQGKNKTVSTAEERQVDYVA
jgi:diguanylate cyclase (GGDEF)-like protein